MQQQAGAARGRHNKRTREQCNGRQCNNQLIFCHAATSICNVVIYCAAMALPSIVVCNTTTAIRGIVFGGTARAMARNRVMAKKMAVALEEEGNGKGRKSNGDGNKEGNGEQQRQR
jgi:hypothetical protein